MGDRPGLVDTSLSQELTPMDGFQGALAGSLVGPLEILRTMFCNILRTCERCVGVKTERSISVFVARKEVLGMGKMVAF